MKYTIITYVMGCCYFFTNLHSMELEKPNLEQEVAQLEQEKILTKESGQQSTPSEKDINMLTVSEAPKAAHIKCECDGGRAQCYLASLAANYTW